MQTFFAVALTAALTLGAGSASAQGLVAAGDQTVTPTGQAATATALGFAEGQFDLSPATRAMPPAPFKSIGRDFGRFFSTDTAHLLVAAGGAAIMARMVDQKAIIESQEHLGHTAFEPGNIGGSFLAQAGVALGTWAIGHATGHPAMAALGGDLVRAQALSQGIVQAGKLLTRRERPDGSNHASFPSGHTASAFATADVLQRHFGWKAGVPAFGFAAYVGAARMQANKHHLSDVVMGAAIGIAAARTVTLGVGEHRFGVGVAPTVGGAAVVFTKQR